MMLIMGQSNRIWHYWAGRYPGSVGVLIGPSYKKKVPVDPWMPFVLDNDAFTAWRDKKEWDYAAWKTMLEWVKLTRLKPLWAAVPDVVANREATIANWGKYAMEVKAMGFPTAFCVQDGMKPQDVPPDADVIFVGGTDGWKFPNLPMWTEHFPRVHCARVNSVPMFEACERLGCVSVDGTGWFRDTARWMPRLEAFVSGHRSSTKQTELDLFAKPDAAEIAASNDL